MSTSKVPFLGGSGFAKKVSWNDLRFPANGISIGGLSSPPDQQVDTGLLLFDGGTTLETIAVLAQIPHSWKEGSELLPHVHWRKTSDVAGDVVWSFRYTWIDYDDVPAAFGSITTATDTNTVDATQKSIISAFPGVDGTGHNISAMLLIQLGRVPTDAGDTYPDDAVLDEFDIHYEIDALGSRQEFIK